jgi:hypothetical protein
MVINGSLNHRQLIDELVRHCREGVSGTIFFNLHSGESARLVLNRGNICWAAYQQLRGIEAIEAISEITDARFNFNPLLKLAIGEQQLPPTIKILRRLYKHNNTLKPEDDPPVVTDVVSPPYPQIEIDGERHFSRDQVHSALEQEVMEYLGPIAKVLCSDYLKNMPPQLTLGQVRQLISTLKQDINDERKGRQFMMGAERALKIQ